LPGQDLVSPAGFQHPVDARPADAERLGDLSSADAPWDFISRTCAELIEAGRPL